MTSIKQEDLIQSIADAFQYISYYHPLDFIKALGEAYDREENPAAKDAIAQILTNSRMSAEGHRPICQDTGIGMVFLKVGMNVRWDDATMTLQEMVNEGVKRAYADPTNPLRASSRMPPPTSIFKLPSLAMAAMVCRFAVVSSLAPSRSTTCRYFAPASINSCACATGSAL